MIITHVMCSAPADEFSSFIFTMFFLHEFLSVFIIIILVPITGQKELQSDLSSNLSSVIETVTAGDEVIQCRESNTTCTDGMCYRKIDLCDGWNDCNDGTDENPDTCKDAPDISKFECSNGKFIHIYQVCDGIVDCKDETDEDDDLCYDPTAKECQLTDTLTSRIQCEFKGVPIPCELSVKAMANVKIFCNLGYVPENDDEWIDVNKCRNSGKWLYKLPHCTFDCGKPKKGTYPWNVIVYERVKVGYNRTCLGTLITPRQILTDHKCTYSKPAERLLDERIQVGLEYLHNSSSFYDCHRIHPQLIGVPYGETLNEKGDIIFFHDFNEIELSKVDTKMVHSYMKNKFKMAVLTLRNHIDVKEFTPACFDLFNRLQVNSNTTGKVVIKFHYTNHATDGYEYADFRIQTRNDCQTYLNELIYQSDNDSKVGAPQLRSDEFCALYDGCGTNCINRSSPIILGGSGLSVHMKGKYYIYGAYVGTIDGQDDNGKNIQVYVFSDVRFRTPQTRYPGSDVNIAAGSVKRVTPLLLRQEVLLKNCFIPNTPGASFSQAPCFNKTQNCKELITHKKMEEYSIIFIHCEENYRLKGPHDYMVCENKTWVVEGITCIRLCEPIRTIPSVNTNCIYEGRNISCVDKVMAETMAISTCNSGGLVKDLTTYENTCLHSGNWRDSPEVVQIFCIDLCGIINSERPLVQDGEEVNTKYHPWNAGLYLEFKKGRHALICGGTLVSKYAVLSAAHCLQKGNDGNRRAEQIKVGLGKMYRKYNHPLDSQAQLREVESIYVPRIYDGAPSAYVADIAILGLKVAAELNEFVLPACIDTSNKFSLKNNAIGSVVGWGFNGTGENAKQTDTLMRADLPYLNREHCLEKTEKEFNFTIRLTIDKFCASHFKDGKPIVRRGDSGSGITFKFEGRYYVYGLVSIQANDLTTTFTNVTHPDHLEFINNVFEQILGRKKEISKK